MKANLLHADRDVDLTSPLPDCADDVARDLDLNSLAVAMSGGEEFLRTVALRMLLQGLDSPQEIRYRQHVLSDTLWHPKVVRQLYEIVTTAVESERHVFRGFLSQSPSGRLDRSLNVLALLQDSLQQLRRVCALNRDGFASAGFTRLFASVATELDTDYFADVDRHLRQLSFPGGVLMSARLSEGNVGNGYVLRRDLAPRSWPDRLRRRRPGHSFEIPSRDENGFTALRHLRDRGVALAADATTRATDHLLDFLRLMRAELGFYVACLNLHEQLTAKGEPTCYPEPSPTDERRWSARDLYDVCLSLRLEARVVPNDLAADGKQLVVITGANSGGKSTFLRGVGLAQVMMQAGMFVPASAMTASVHDRVLTHFRREEDPSMTHGKLDEELDRMNRLADAITPRSMWLSNESFASTNEREASEIGVQVVDALVDGGVQVALVTHLYDLARRLHDQDRPVSLFLRAGREPDGRRTFRILEGAPLSTSYGRDLYGRIFGEPAA
jgi:MutS domain V